MSKIIRNIKSRSKKNDSIYTPLELALFTIDFAEIKEGEIVLDPCRGGGVFYDLLTEPKRWCEIEDGKDFFDFNEKVDCVIGNPPFSCWNKWLEHTFTITDKVCYIIGHMNFIPTRIKKIEDAGFGITKLHYCKVYWWFSPVLIMLLERGCPSVISYTPEPFVCDICKGRCKRGRYPIGMNECGDLS